MDKLVADALGQLVSYEDFKGNFALAKEIAGKKCISFHTVMTHRKNILRKLGVSNASELILYAVKKGIIDTIEYHI